MTREEMIEAAKSIKQPVKQKKLIYKLADELGLKFRDTNCGKCLKDYRNIILEELGLVNNAAEKSSFNGPEGVEYFTTNEPNEDGWLYIARRSQSWNGYLINQKTPSHVIEEFVKLFPKGYYVKIENNNQNNEE